jgi:hypothetical protein
MTAKEIMKSIESLPEVEKVALRTLLKEHPEVIMSAEDLRVQQAHEQVMRQFDASFKELAK